MAEIASAAVETGRSIGRYFAVISMVPSLLFVLYIYGLLAAGAPSNDFEPAKALHAFESLSVGGIVALIATALLLGLVLHPFQFPMTQILEGYWGTSGIGLRLAQQRIKHYRRVARALEDAADDADEEWEKAVETARAKRVDVAREDPQERRRNNITYLDARHGDPMLAHYLRAQAIRSAGNQYPEYGRRMMPTRLGNVLRLYEDMAGQQYGLNILRIAPHLNLVAVKEHREYVDDCRKGLDLGVRLCALFALATALSVGLLADDGAWLLLALAPYCVSYLSYRGAVSSAQAYGTALSTLVDLNRFALYDQLHIPQPSTTEVERNRNEQLLKLLSGKPPYFMRYKHSKNASP
jgi:hypothetical protein